MHTTNQRFTVVLAVVYFIALAGLLFWPFPVDRPIESTITRVITWLHSHGLPQWFIGYRKVEFAANILLFVPFGIILTMRLHRTRWWLGVMIAAAVSGAVELTQATFLPERVPAWSDVVANTSGALIGTLLVLAVWVLRDRRAQRISRRIP